MTTGQVDLGLARVGDVYERRDGSEVTYLRRKTEPIWLGTHWEFDFSDGRSNHRNGRNSVDFPNSHNQWDVVRFIRHAVQQPPATVTPNAGPGCDRGMPVYKSGQVAMIGDTILCKDGSGVAHGIEYGKLYGVVGTHLDGVEIAGRGYWSAARFDLVSRAQPQPAASATGEGTGESSPVGWGVSVLASGEGAMIVQPSPEYTLKMIREKKYPHTSRRIALIETSAYMTHEESVAIAKRIVDQHNASLTNPSAPPSPAETAGDHIADAGKMIEPTAAPAPVSSGTAVIVGPGLYCVDDDEHDVPVEVVGKDSEGVWYGRGVEGPDCWNDFGMSQRWTNDFGNITGPYAPPEPPKPPVLEIVERRREDGWVYAWSKCSLDTIGLRDGCGRRDVMLLTEKDTCGEVIPTGSIYIHRDGPMLVHESHWADVQALVAQVNEART